jgi:hypothetical protein
MLLSLSASVHVSYHIIITIHVSNHVISLVSYPISAS